ncbi:MAG TPA: DUF6582 domain-containing protein [Stellaceae bacterium]|nr:DUF6582 domain-containing protein [Stellaceae bacterium]
MRFYAPIAKVDAEARMVWGYASTDAEDDQGETITRDALAEALDDYMKFANIREMHQMSAVGVAEEAGVDDRGLYVSARIVDPRAWDKVTSGVYKGFSVGGKVRARDPRDRNVITGLTLTEISLVDRPANPEAVFDCWKAEGSGADAADFADPGYQADGEKRYPLDDEPHIRAAWAFIHMPGDAARYTADEVDRIKARIIAAWQATIDPAGPPAAKASRQDVQAAHDALCRAGARCGGFVDDPGHAENGKAARGEDLMKAVAAAIVPRLEELERSVAALLAAPLPPQTVARPATAVSKRDDGGYAAVSPEDVAAALARMSDEERTLALIKAAHANPIRPFR